MDAALLGPAGRTVLESTVMTIGCTADNQLVVSDAKVSSHHAELCLIGQGYSLIDLSSANGTFFNEQQLESGVPRPLKAGDIIRVGDTTFRYEVSDVSQMMTSASATLSQASNPPVVVAPSEFIAYGQDVQEAYPSPLSSAHSFHTPLPQLQSYIPLPPAYQPDTPLPPPQQPSGPPATVGGIPTPAANVPPHSYVQQSYIPPGVPSTVPTYTAPAPPTILPAAIHTAKVRW